MFNLFIWCFFFVHFSKNCIIVNSGESNCLTGGYGIFMYFWVCVFMAAKMRFCDQLSSIVFRSDFNKTQEVEDHFHTVCYDFMYDNWRPKTFSHMEYIYT